MIRPLDMLRNWRCEHRFQDHGKYDILFDLNMDQFF